MFSGPIKSIRLHRVLEFRPSCSHVPPLLSKMFLMFLISLRGESTSATSDVNCSELLLRACFQITTIITSTREPFIVPQPRIWHLKGRRIKKNSPLLSSFSTKTRLFIYWFPDWVCFHCSAVHLHLFQSGLSGWLDVRAAFVIVVS